MIVRHPRLRRAAHDAAMAGVVLSATMLALGLWTFGTRAGSTAAHAAGSAGNLSVVVPKGQADQDKPLLAGGSATLFALVLPTGAACTGDSASGGYRVQSYMVPASVDPATLKFDAVGPTPYGVGAALRLPLYKSDGGEPYTDESTDIKVGSGGGHISGVPAFSFAVFGDEGPEVVKPGSYNLGLACTKGTADSATQLDKYWNVQFAVTADSTDKPSGLKWTAAEQQAASTTTSLSASPGSGAKPGEQVTLTATVSPPGAAGKVTFKDGTSALGEAVTVAEGTAKLTTDDLGAGSHTLTASFAPTAPASFAASTSAALTYEISGSTSTTSSTTTSTPSSSTTTSSTIAGAGSGATGGSSSADPSASGSFASTSTGGGLSGAVTSLAYTGQSLSLAVWAVLLVVFGRMVILLGRTTPVVPRGA